MCTLDVFKAADVPPYVMPDGMPSELEAGESFEVACPQADNKQV